MNSKIRAGLVPALFFVALALIAGAAGYFSAGSGPKHGSPIATSQASFIRGVVQNATTDRLTVTTAAGSLDLRIEPNAPFEVLRPTNFDRVTIGDWINGGAIANAQTLFALSGIVVIPNSLLAAPR